MDFDAIVIGSGAGGGTAAAELARAGKRVLLVERGRRFDAADSGQDERQMLIDRAACDDRSIYVNAVRTRPISGGVLGGSTSLYGAALLRPGPSDFEPGRYYGDRIPRHLWEWPIAYEAMRPYFDRAEDLYGVAGDASAAMPHLGRRQRPYAQPAAPFEPISQRLADAWRDRGLAPFPLPLAIDADRCLRCPTCPGYACPNGARASSVTRAIDPARRDHDLVLREHCEAERFEVIGGRVRGVWLRDRATGERELLRAGVYLLAAGAIGTPVLLLRSGLTGRSNQVGRNHMCHLGAAAIGIFARPTGAAQRFAKQVGLSDFYLGTPGFEHKLGYAQVVPVPGPLSLAEHAPLPIPQRLARALHERALLLVGSIEDLPQPRNRVSLGSGDTICLQRRFHAYDVLRAKRLVRELRRLLRAAGASLRLGHVAANAHAHVAHQVGTARFGRDPRTSVIDAQCRLHGQDDVYVVDGSFFPTSLGVGPALTIIANAVRVADHIAKERA
jgi:choline dehydrogenase-like flavoprotein